MVDLSTMSARICTQLHCAPLHIKKALGIFRQLIPTTTTTVAFWDPPSGSKNNTMTVVCTGVYSTSVHLKSLRDKKKLRG